MAGFLCPICGTPLTETPRGAQCVSGHSFDRAKQGYVNLLLSQSSRSKRHGDDKLMVRSRTAFLEKGYYSSLRDALIAAVLPASSPAPVILDAGCGEGWYSEGLDRALRKTGKTPEILAVDISKEAVIAASRRNRNWKLAVASLFSLPVADGACDFVLNIFSPLAAEEYWRVLKPGGLLLRAVPLERHLWELKAAVYDRPYPNPPEDPVLPGFRLQEKREIRTVIRLEEPEDIRSLFRMTPYYYKTSAADQAKLDRLTNLETTLEFGLLSYQKAAEPK